MGGRSITGVRSVHFFTPKTKRRAKPRRSFIAKKKKGLLRLHPLFLAVGVWYAFKGELFLFLLSALVAVQHECAHAFAAAKLGYKLNRIILMPFGAVIDGDLRGISFRDEITVALWGPLCNLFTALFFVALWWLYPTSYAFTDTACQSSLSIALINFLPAYPLDGGRILRCALARLFASSMPDLTKAEQRAIRVCRALTFLFAFLALFLFFLFLSQGRFNVSLLFFSGFLCFGAIGGKSRKSYYEKLDVSVTDALSRGVEIRRVAVLESCSIKDALQFVSRGCYLVLEVYNKQEERLFELTQNELNGLLLLSKSPYEQISRLQKRKNSQKKEEIA